MQHADSAKDRAFTYSDLQTFDFDKPGELTSLERNACLCYYNQQHPERVCNATNSFQALLLLLCFQQFCTHALELYQHLVSFRILH